MKRKAFTLIELLVVIAIIGLLSSIILVSTKGIRGKARDAKRTNDLELVMLSLNLYYDDYGTFCVQNSGWLGEGYGWLNHQYSNDYYSVSKQLVNLGYIGGEIEDPQVHLGYMIVCDSNHVTLWATLEGSSTLDNCYHSWYDTGYGKNYCISQ
jgi:prepilin-type N-terminal cleavage/methylation domain-containing protein